MRLRYTYHARLRMQLRRVSDEMVEQTVYDADTTAVGYEQREIALKLFPDRGTLKVVYARFGTAAVIVTVVWE